MLFHTKYVFDDGSIVEMKIWKVVATEDKPHGLKYSLVYVKDGKRIVGYDNGEGKGDHRHYGNREEPYHFEGVDKLIADFLRDVEAARRKG